MGKGTLGIIPIEEKVNQNTKMNTISQFTKNTEVRKLIPCRKTNRVILLEIKYDVENNDKNCTEINCVDLDLKASIFKKEFGVDQEASNGFGNEDVMKKETEIVKAANTPVKGSYDAYSACNSKIEPEKPQFLEETKNYDRPQTPLELAPGIRIYRYTKSFEINKNEDIIFTVGVHVEVEENLQTNTTVIHGQKGFISAMKLTASMPLLAYLTIPHSCHPDKKGMYRIHRMSPESVASVTSKVPHEKTTDPGSLTTQLLADRGLDSASSSSQPTFLLISGWIDIYIYAYYPSEQLFSSIYKFNRIHHDLIYNIVSIEDKGFYTCSNDCDVTAILL